MRLPNQVSLPQSPDPDPVEKGQNATNQNKQKGCYLLSPEQRKPKHTRNARVKLGLTQVQVNQVPLAPPHPPCEAKLVSCSPSTSKTLAQAGLGAMLFCRGVGKLGDGSRSTAQGHLRARAFACLCSHLLHPGTPSPRRATPSCGRALQAVGARLGETELKLHVKKARSLCVSQTTRITSLEPLYLISFPRFCGPRQAAARLSSARCHPRHLAWGPGQCFKPTLKNLISQKIPMPPRRRPVSWLTLESKEPPPTSAMRMCS